MAAVQITGAVWPTFRGGRLGPFKDSSGNLWVVAFNSSTQPTAYKSTDGGATWSTVASYTTAMAADVLDCAFDVTNQIFYVLCVATGGSLTVVQYVISTGLWGVTASAGPSPGTDANGVKAAALNRRSDGSTVIAYQGPSASVMGKSYRRVFFTTLDSSNVWGTATECDGGSGTQNNYDLKSAVTDGSNTYIAFAAGSPTSDNVTTITSGNAIGVAGTQLTSASSGSATGIGSAFYDSTLNKVVIMPTGGGHAYRATPSSSPTWTVDSTAVGSYNGTSPLAFIYESGSGKLYAFYGDASGFMYGSTSTTTWPADTFFDSTKNQNGLSLGIISGAIGIVFNASSGGTVWFETYALSSTKSITPSGISATSTFGGSVTARKLIKPATVLATSTVGGSVTAKRKIAPAVVSAISTVSGAVSKVIPPKNITPATISATSTVSGGVVRRRPIAGTISALSTLSGLIVARRAISGVIAATSSVSGAVPALRRITGAIAATSIVSGAVHALRRIAPVTNILAAGAVSGAIGRKRSVSGNVSAVSTVAGAVVAYRRVAPATVLATSTVSGAVTDLHAGKTFGGSISATSTVSGSFVRRVAVSGVVSALSTLSGRVTARRAVGGAITAVSVVSGAIGRVRRLAASILATSTVAGSTTARHRIAGNVLAMSSVSGALTRHGTGSISGNISATSTVAGSVVRLLPLVGGTISAPATVSGSTGVKRRIVGNIVATSAVSGVIHLRLPISGGIFATSTLSGQVAPLRGVGGNVVATSTVSGTVVFQRVISGAILAPATVSGAIRLKPTTIFVYGPGHQGVILYTGAGTIQDQPSGGRIPVQSRRGVIR